jgi:hypothetical protein
MAVRRRVRAARFVVGQEAHDLALFAQAATPERASVRALLRRVQDIARAEHDRALDDDLRALVPRSWCMLIADARSPTAVIRRTGSGHLLPGA